MGVDAVFVVNFDMPASHLSRVNLLTYLLSRSCQACDSWI